jgi:hypothetical protein
LVPESIRRPTSVLPGVATDDVVAPRVVAHQSRLLQTGLAGLSVTLLLPQFLPGVTSSYLLVIAVAAGAALLIAGTEDAAHRGTSLNLFVWALLCRCLAVTACYALGAREGGPFLGPDSTTYFTRGGELAASAFHLDIHPVLALGSYDVSHYYLFAAAIRYLHTDLFGLQVMNCAFIALSVPLMYGIARIILPSSALVVGLAIALHPSLIALSAVDLLKDPSIIFGTAFLIWVIVRLTRERNGVALAAYFAGGLVIALYLRTGRFYSFAYLELAFLAAVAFMMILRITVFQRALAAALVVIIFLVGEVVPARASWPPSPLMIASNVSYVLDTPAMSQYATGLFDRWRLSSGRMNSGPAGDKGPIMVPVHIGPESGPFALLGTALSFGANVFRRLYGPFVWILPEDWHFKALQAGDYLLYPGMLVWYGLLPLIVVGLGATAWRIATRTETRFGVVFLWCFTAIYFAQYLMINLSYRQRDVMLPVLLFFAYLGLPDATHLARWRSRYVGYWLVLALLAGGHLLVRAFLRA